MTALPFVGVTITEGEDDLILLHVALELPVLIGRVCREYVSQQLVQRSGAVHPPTDPQERLSSLSVETFEPVHVRTFLF